jgi:D-arginine dehydrogenase
VVGGGIIGASAAAFASRHYKTILVEQESVVGYHSSGRSAAVLLPSYGGPSARALTAASRDFLSNPPSGFSDSSLIGPRGALFIAPPGRTHLLQEWAGPGEGSARGTKLLTPAQVADVVPILRTAEISQALYIPEVVDIDAAALLQGFVKSLRANGGTLLVNARVGAILHSSSGWTVETSAGTVCAKMLVNAAGAWADAVAELAGVAPKGLVPTRRTMFLIDAPESVNVSAWPLVADVDETFYFKPDAGRLAVSPADRAESKADDVLAEDLDVAIGVERFEAATTMTVRRVRHQWAGLRTFAPDNEPIVGFDPAAPDFVWAAGFGGFGVQASVGAGRCCEALLRGESLPARLQDCGADLGMLSPKRLSRAGL